MSAASEGARAADRLAAALDGLRAQGQRVTGARRAVLELLANTDDHLSADDIAERLESVAPEVHRATVYRTLDALRETGLVTHVHLPHGAATYHLASADTPGHVHLVCRGCDRVVDAPVAVMAAAIERADAELGFVLDPDHVALTGWCADCRGAAGR